MLNAHGHYIVSSLLLRLPHTLLILPGLLATQASNWAELQPVLLAYGAGLMLCSLILLFFLTQVLRRGSIRISLRERFEGLVFFASTAIALMPDPGVVVIAGALVTPERLAAYAAMAVLLRPFRLVTQVLSAIMTPELIRRERPNYRGLLIGLWALAIAAALATVIFGPHLARWIYEGRYEEGVRIIPLLALVGALQLTAILPKSDLTGKAAMRTFRRLIYSLMGVMGVLAAIGVALISRFGLIGIASTALILQAARSLLAYGFWRGYRKAAEAKAG
jgi:O-antigen/teichoic acid export membrane protein